MIQKINSSDNKYNLKQNIILASIGGTALGAIEANETRKELISTKESFKFLLKTLFYNKEHNNAIDEYFKSELEKISFKHIKEKTQKSIDEYYQNTAKLMKKTKQDYKNRIKDIKSKAPLKIALKTLGGAAIGLGISLLINYIKDKTKKK